MKLPKRLRFGPYSYRAVWTDDRSIFGATDNDRCVIRLAKWPTREQQRATFLHESLHAALFASGAARALEIDEVVEEKLVRLLEPWLLALLRDNPEFVAFVTE